MRAFFGDAHPYSRSTNGTVKTVEAIDLDSVKAWHKKIHGVANGVILVAGDISTDKLKASLEKRFGSAAPSGGAAKLTVPTYPKPATDSLRVVLVHRPEAVQTVVRFMMPAPKYASPDRNRLELLGTILGGSFTSRLNQNLREDKGYTYGARCNYAMNPSAGYFSASARVRADVTGASIGEFLKEFKSIRGGDITPAEMAKSQATLRMQTVQSFAGLGGLVAVAGELVRNDRPFDALSADLNDMAKVTADQLNKMARAAVPLEGGLLVLVGDRETILPQLAGLGLPDPVEYSPEGDPM